MIIDCISDLHGEYPKLDGGDLLIISGDMTGRDTTSCWNQFFTWLDAQNYRKKLYIGGNHDNFLTKCCNNVQCVDISYGPECEKQEYLCDSGTEFEGLKIWGSPWTRSFLGMNPSCMAFTLDRNEELNEKWKLIPDDIDILITHSPPYRILDRIQRLDPVTKVHHVGCKYLREHVMVRIKPKIHVFGHIHGCGGTMLDCVTTKFVNASIMDEVYDPIHKPVRIEI